jgi:hypothetical protein
MTIVEKRHSMTLIDGKAKSRWWTIIGEVFGDGHAGVGSLCQKKQTFVISP